MQPTTESILLQRLTDGNDTVAYTAYVTGHLGIVYNLARKACNGDGVELLDELISEGKLALCEAARAFPAQQLSCRFSTYAHPRIWGAIVSYRRSNGANGAVAPSTEWQARMADEARSTRQWVEQWLADHEYAGSPSVTPEDIAYVSKRYSEHIEPQDTQRHDAYLTPIRCVSWEELAESETAASDLSCQPRDSFAIPFAKLPISLRQVLAVLTDLVSAVGNFTPGMPDTTALMLSQQMPGTASVSGAEVRRELAQLGSMIGPEYEQWQQQHSQDESGISRPELTRGVW